MMNILRLVLLLLGDVLLKMTLPQSVLVLILVPHLNRSCQRVQLLLAQVPVMVTQYGSVPVLGLWIEKLCPVFARAVETPTYL